MPKKKKSTKKTKLQNLVKTHKKLRLQLHQVAAKISAIPYKDLPQGSDIPYSSGNIPYSDIPYKDR